MRGAAGLSVKSWEGLKEEKIPDSEVVSCVLVLAAVKEGYVSC